MPAVQRPSMLERSNDGVLPGSEQFPVLQPHQFRWRLWREWCFVRAAAALQTGSSDGTSTFGILTYHQVAQRSEHDVQMLSVTPERFRQQMQGLLRFGYQPLELRRAIELHHRRLPVPRRSFVVVFDDGYQGVYLNAWEVLRELKIPATIFLATAYLDRAESFPFDAYRPQGAHAASARPLSRAQCREMQASGGIEFGSHTHTHQDFRGRTDEFRRDLDRSLAVLSDDLGCSEPAFAFPFGFVDDELTEAARKSGVLCSLTADNELVDPTGDPFCWGRLGATQLDTAASLAAKLEGWYAFFRRVYQRVSS